MGLLKAIYSFLKSFGYKESVRAEELSIETYLKLTDYLSKH